MIIGHFRDGDATRRHREPIAGYQLKITHWFMRKFPPID